MNRRHREIGYQHATLRRDGDVFYETRFPILEGVPLLDEDALKKATLDVMGHHPPGPPPYDDLAFSYTNEFIR